MKPKHLKMEILFKVDRRGLICKCEILKSSVSLITIISIFLRLDELKVKQFNFLEKLQYVLGWLYMNIVKLRLAVKLESI